VLFRVGAALRRPRSTGFQPVHEGALLAAPLAPNH